MQKNNIETPKKKEYLYQLESLIKTLYPSYKTTNPYDSYLQMYYEELVIEDVLLFKRLLKSITLLNHKERTQEGRHYISSYGDVLTAIELMSNHTINDVLMSSYVQLKDIFTNHSFTKLQASRVLRKSTRSIERYIELWQHLKLVTKLKQKQGSKHLYQLNHYTPPETMCDTVFEEFIDYKGFEEF